ncbi:MAG: hypothetical protein IAE87_15250 [Rhodobacteraceae bacterium]|jgi:hypothetical protein|nr:hypothetical protein [Paracoccaceae bacterium]
MAPADPVPAVDLAVMSYRKAASLIYTLFTLHRHSAGRIGTVWLTDDCSRDGTAERLADPELARRLQPWRLDLATTRRPGRWGLTQVTPGVLRRALRPGMPLVQRLRTLNGLLRLGLLSPADVRYQRALAATRAPFLLLLHDDVELRGDVVGHLLQAITADPGCAIAGPLGQCWRCGERAAGCTPAQVVAGSLPSSRWPETTPPPGMRFRRRDRACRINEWCALIRVAAARDLARDGIFFGNVEDGGDVGAYWFAAALAQGWRFADPFQPGDGRDLFLHGWQGHPGHAVWIDQGSGRKSYDEGEIRARLDAEFDYRMPR